LRKTLPAAWASRYPHQDEKKSKANFGELHTYLAGLYLDQCGIGGGTIILQNGALRMKKTAKENLETAVSSEAKIKQQWQTPEMTVLEVNLTEVLTSGTHTDGISMHIS
jgi:hypothetical protein